MRFWLGAIFAIVSVPSLMADTYFNTRPDVLLPHVSVDSAQSGYSPQLQDTLNTIYKCNGCVDAHTGQSTAAEWTPTALNQITTDLVIEFAGDADKNVFGIWSSTNGNITRVPIFLGPASATPGDPAWAMLHWNSTGNLDIFSSNPNVNVGTGITGIDVNAFGFYLQNGSGAASNVFYTADALNPDQAPQALTYYYNANGTGTWTIAFEDRQFNNGSDKDFNDLVASVTNITPVPEPSAIVLLGTGILGAMAVIRRKRRNAVC